MHADVARVTKHHLVALLAVRRATHIADDVLIVLNTESFLIAENRLNAIPTSQLVTLDDALQLIFTYGTQSRRQPFGVQQPQPRYVAFIQIVRARSLRLRRRRRQGVLLRFEPVIFCYSNVTRFWPKTVSPNVIIKKKKQNGLIITPIKQLKQ